MTSSPGSASPTIWRDDWREVTSSYRVGASVGRNIFVFSRKRLFAKIYPLERDSNLRETKNCIAYSYRKRFIRDRDCFRIRTMKDLK